MAKVKEGDRVRIVARDSTDEDIKSGIYYSHYAGMTGTVQKVYSAAEVAVDVEHDSLSREIRKRHEDVRDQMKTKWLDGLSEEGRSKLTEREKDFNLRYVVLVKMDDLESAGKRPETGFPAPPAAHATTVPDADAASRRTLADFEAAEQEELLRRAQNPEA